MKKLVIVEAAGKIKCIQKSLGDNYIVVASGGHIQDLKQKELSVDIDNNFKPTYNSTAKQLATIFSLQEMAKSSSLVYLATDLDYEGYFIAYSCIQLLKLKNYKRIIFNNTNKETILKAIKNGGELDMAIVNAQITRRIIDRLYGYLVSQDIRNLLSKDFSKKDGNISAGRVQSVFLKIIYEKELEIKDFFEKSNTGFFKIHGVFSSLNSTMYTIDSEPDVLPFVGKIAKIPSTITNEEIEELLSILSKSKYKIVHISDEIVSRHPKPPYETSSMQEDAIRIMKISGKQVMQIAQKLYQNGHITYIRTDCITISDEGHQLIHDTILDKFGKKYYHRRDAKSSKNAQEAHEAIRPTHPEKEPEIIDPDEKRLYDIIWNRTLASQMADSKHRVMTIQIKIIKNTDYYFESTSEELIFDGFQKIFNLKTDDKLKSFDVDSIVVLEKMTATMDFNKPPSRFTESTLLSKMKKLGVGRPATTTNIVSHLLEHNHIVTKNYQGIQLDSITYNISKTKKISKKIKKVTIGKENKVFFTTDMGKAIISCLLKNFSNMLDIEFTANIEKEMLSVSKNKKKWQTVVEIYYNELKKSRDSLAKIMPVLATPEKICKYNNLDIFYSNGPHGPYVFYLDENKTKICRRLDNIDKKDTESIIKLFENNQEKSKPLFEYKKHKVYLRNGSYGEYISYRKNPKSDVYINRNIKGFNVEDVDKLILLLEHPKVLGKLKKIEIQLCYGAKGYYLKFNNQYVSTNNKKVDLDKAIEIISSRLEN